MRRASIDIGSNSILLLVADLEPSFTILQRESHVTGLGRDIDKNQAFIQEAMDESFSVLQEYQKIIESFGLKTKDTIITATEASRVAQNRSSFFAHIKKELGFDIKLISGEQEAYFSSLGVIRHSTVKDSCALIMDIGGASTEFIEVHINPFKVAKSISLPLGSVRVTNYIAAQKADEIIAQVLRENNLEPYKKAKMICVAGTMTSVGNMIKKNKEFIEDDLNGFSFSFDTLLELEKKIALLNEEELLKEYPFLKKRVKTIKAGIFLAVKLLSFLEVKEIEISTYGLMYGTILNKEMIV